MGGAGGQAFMAFDTRSDVARRSWSQSFPFSGRIESSGPGRCRKEFAHVDVRKSGSRR
jgi:hypothetical protein